MSLSATLGGQLDASSLVGGLGGQLDAHATALGNVSVPISSDDLHAATSGTSQIDASGIGGAVGQLAQLAEPLIQSLPIAHDILGPLTDVIELVEKATKGELTTALDGLKTKLATELGGDGGIVGVLLRVSQVLADAPEGKVLLDLVKLVTGMAHVQLPTQLPVGDGLQAADNTLRVTGGLMALESILVESERLTGAMAAQLDAPGLQGRLRALQAALDGTTTSLPDFVAAVPASDPAQVAAAVQAVTAVAAQLDAVNQQLATAMGFGEATLVYMDVDKVQLELTAASAIVRSAELDALGRVMTKVAAQLAPVTSFDLGGLASQTFDGLINAAEGKVAELGAKIAAVDVAAIAKPVSDALGTVAGVIGKISDIITKITVGFQTAMNAVRDAVAALPVHQIVDAINVFLKPITDVLGKITQIIDTVHATLKTVADATHAVIDQVGKVLDDFKAAVDTLFLGAKKFVGELHIDQVVGAINDAIRAFADVLAKAQMKPYFDTADDAINTTADVISKIPFGLLPDSMKQKVDDAVKPIKEIDAGAVQTEIEGLLDFQPDPHDPNKRVFAVRDVVNQAIHDVQVKYDKLIADVKALDPRGHLSVLDDKLHKVADAVHGWSPALTLQPLTDAVNQVKGVILGLDLEAQLEPVHDVFTQIEAKLDEFNPTRFVQPVEDRITEARTKLYDFIKIKKWIPTIDDATARANAVLDKLNPDRLGRQLEAALGDALAALQLPTLKLSGSLGSVIASLAGALGLRISAASFDEVSTWLAGSAHGNAALTARAGRIADAIKTTRDGVQALDVATLGVAIVQRMQALAPAVTALAGKLTAGSTAQVTLTALVPRLSADARFGALAENRTRYLATLEHSATLAEGLRATGFSEADDAAAKWQAAMAPLAPARDFVKRTLTTLGIQGMELGVAGVLRALLAVAPPHRLVGIFTPLFSALRDRVTALVTALVTPVKAGIQNLNDLLDKIDLKPLTDAIDGVFKEVKSQIAALDPMNLLKAPLDAFKKLQNDLRTQDPMQQVIQIITNLRDAVSALLAKLDAKKLLATPLQIFDEIVSELEKLKLEHLLDPVFNQLDNIAEQVHEGLTNTVTAFEHLQASLPGDGGGASAAVSGSVSVVGGIG